MPYITIDMSKSISEEQKDQLASEIGKAITAFPGKTDRALMIGINDGRLIYNHGVRQENCAYLDISMHGSFPYEMKNDFTVRVYEIFERLFGTTDSNLYVTITEYDDWGVYGKLWVSPPHVRKLWSLLNNQ